MRMSIIVLASLSLAACSGQSRYVNAPIGISTSINGLQQSSCNCGGLQPAKEVREREKAIEKTPVADRKPIEN